MGELGSSAVLSTGFASGGGESTQLTVLVDGVHDPVDAGVVTDGSMSNVDQDDLVELVGGVLVDPVGVEHTEVSASLGGSLLGLGAQRTLPLELVNTLSGGLSVDNTLGGRSLSSSSSHTDSVDHISLLGLVSETAGLVRSGGARSTVDSVQLSVLPAANTQNETQNIALLLAPKFFQVFVST